MTFIEVFNTANSALQNKGFRSNAVYIYSK